MFPSGPEPFRHPDCLEEALALAVEYNLKAVSRRTVLLADALTRVFPHTDAEGLVLQPCHYVRF